MKQKYIDLAKTIIEGKIPPAEREKLEDELVEMAYQIASGLEVSPEELETARDERRSKNVVQGSIGEAGTKLLRATKKTEIVEHLGEVLEIVETYTAKY